MQIKDRETLSLQDRLCRLFRFFASKKTRIAACIAIGIAGIVIGLLIAGFFGTFDSPSPRAREFIRSLGVFPLMQEMYGVAKTAVHPYKYITGQFSNPDIITIDIAFENMELLRKKRGEALVMGTLFASNEDFVPVTIRYKDKNYKADIRLKGDNQDHWNDEKKWSFRVQLDGENTILGMKKFSLQHPKTRGYMNEWYLYKLMAYSGIIALRYDFIEVIVNGENWGIYAIEEHFDKRLIEYNQKREGPIFKFDDYLCMYKEHMLNCDEIYTYSAIDPFEEKTLLENEELRNAFIRGKELLESFRRGEKTTREVFDMDQVARLFAMSDILGYHHLLWYSNIKFYYNPITSLLEPIGYDNQFIQPLSEVNSILGAGMQIDEQTEKDDKELSWIDNFFKDEMFFRTYIQYLQEFSKEEYLDNFFRETKEEANEKMKILYKSYPWYKFDREQIPYKNQEYIAYILKPLEGIQAYLKKSDERAREITLLMGNINPLPIEIVEVLYKERPTIYNEKIILQAKKPLQTVTFKESTFKVSSNEDLDAVDNTKIIVKYKVLGTENIQSAEVSVWPYVSEELLTKGKTPEVGDYKDFEFLDVDEEKKVIHFEKGTWVIDKELKIPQGFVVVIEGGTNIDLTNNARIISQSPIIMRGDENMPIKIFSSDKTGQGITLLSIKEKSEWQHVIFQDLSEPKAYGQIVTAVVTIYQSPINMNYIKFESIKSEDALNIVRSEFELDHISFKDTLSDCFDSDFSQGTIRNAVFMNCGNDGMDFSGSIVSVDNIMINKVGDKGISAGEMSDVAVDKISINGAYIGIASKDKSMVKANDIRIKNVKYAIAVYEKKPEFGKSSLIITNFTETEYTTIIEKNSMLTINGVLSMGNMKNVYEVLYGKTA
ncbi:MAG: CotH kinase family protein [Candidatus Woesearchaeota archaeon]|nr:CotH kinase family protein [Candidatus Woesearchaeota archaeon]